MVEYINAMNTILFEDAKARSEKEKRANVAKHFSVVVEPLHQKDHANNHSQPSPPDVKFRHKKNGPPPEKEEEYKDPGIGTVIDFIA